MVASVTSIHVELWGQGGRGGGMAQGSVSRLGVLGICERMYVCGGYWWRYTRRILNRGLTFR
jgi:hypothetical protein